MKKKRNAKTRAYLRRLNARKREGKPEPAGPAKPARHDGTVNPSIALFVYQALRKLKITK